MEDAKCKPLTASPPELSVGDLHAALSGSGAVTSACDLGPLRVYAQPPQSGVGISTESMTSTSRGPRRDSNLRPSCSSNAVDIAGRFGSLSVTRTGAAAMLSRDRIVK